MKKFIYAFVLTFLLSTASSFADGIYGDWAKDGISKANRAGILSVNQYAGDYTKPIKREEIAELIVKAYENASGETAEFYGNKFSDSDNKYVSLAFELELMNGRGDGIFSPDDNTTRQEMAKIMLVLKSKVNGTPLKLPMVAKADFTDFSQVSEWAKPYVAMATSEGIINGYEDGSFGGLGDVSWQEAVVLVGRTVELITGEQPEISGLTDNDVISPMDDVILRSSIGESKIYMSDSNGTTTLLGETRNGSEVVVPGGTLAYGVEYNFFAESGGVFSECISVRTETQDFVMSIPDAVYKTEKITWDNLSGNVTLKVTEHRLSYHEGEIPPNETKVYEVVNQNYFDLPVNPNRKYVIEIICGDYYDTKTVYTDLGSNSGASEIKANYPKTKEEAEAQMVEVNVPVWRLKGDEKVSATVDITVNEAIADKVKLVFEEIFNGIEKFPIKDVGGFSWRGGKSEHNGGTAIDINADENFCIYKDGRVVGNYWKLYEDPYSITPYGDVVNAFERYGFTWGGDAWSGTKDYMHFSYLGT